MARNSAGSPGWWEVPIAPSSASSQQALAGQLGWAPCPQEPDTQTLAPLAAPQPELPCRVTHLPKQGSPHVSTHAASGKTPAMPWVRMMPVRGSKAGHQNTPTFHRGVFRPQPGSSLGKGKLPCYNHEMSRKKKKKSNLAVFITRSQTESV